MSRLGDLMDDDGGNSDGSDSDDGDGGDEDFDDFGRFSFQPGPLIIWCT